MRYWTAWDVLALVGVAMVATPLGWIVVGIVLTVAGVGR